MTEGLHTAVLLTRSPSHPVVCLTPTSRLRESLPGQTLKAIGHAIGRSLPRHEIRCCLRMYLFWYKSHRASSSNFVVGHSLLILAARYCIAQHHMSARQSELHPAQKLCIIPFLSHVTVLSRVTWGLRKGTGHLRSPIGHCACRGRLSGRILQ